MRWERPFVSENIMHHKIWKRMHPLIKISCEEDYKVGTYNLWVFVVEGWGPLSREWKNSSKFTYRANFRELTSEEFSKTKTISSFPPFALSNSEILSRRLRTYTSFCLCPYLCTSGWGRFASHYFLITNSFPSAFGPLSSRLRNGLSRSAVEPEPRNPYLLRNQLIALRQYLLWGT